MTKPKVYLGYVEFYITNVCNLACKNCNRFNDHKFTGWQRWDDYASVYARWADFIDLKHIVVLGGEPLLNPDILKWCYGLHDIFRGDQLRGIDIVTNGYHINRVAGLREAVASGKVFLSISLHNPDEQDFIMQQVQQFIGPDIAINYDDTKKQWWVHDDNLKIFIVPEYSFATSAVIRNPQGRLTLHNSDPVKAHSICTFVREKNYHFIRGKFYKCGPVALMPEFDRQFNLDISPEDRAMLNTYQPLTVDDFEQRSEEFFRTLDQPIPQCKFCPVNYQWQQLHALPKTAARKP